MTGADMAVAIGGAGVTMLIGFFIGYRVASYEAERARIETAAWRENYQTMLDACCDETNARIEAERDARSCAECLPLDSHMRALVLGRCARNDRVRGG